MIISVAGIVRPLLRQRRASSRARAQTGSSNPVNTRGAKIAELEVPGAAGFVVMGTKTIQVEVKE